MNKTESMKVTEDTKIKDLIPEGYEPELKSGLSMCDDFGYFTISFKKKEVKDFKWYAQKYFDKINKRFCIELIINSDFRNIDFPFEFKIGLLRFICDDIGINMFSYLKTLNTPISSIGFKELERICPPEFLNSIFN